MIWSQEAPLMKVFCIQASEVALRFEASSFSPCFPGYQEKVLPLLFPW